MASKTKEFEFPERFKKRDKISNSSIIQAPKGFIEEDLRKTTIFGINQIIEELNVAMYDYENKENGVVVCKGTNLYGIDCGDVCVEIIDRPDEVEVSVYRLERKWLRRKR